MRILCQLSKLTLIAAFSAALGTNAQAQSSAPSLYKRLGGYDAIAAVTDDFIGRLVSEPVIAPFFKGHSKATLGHIRMRVIEQVCAATGGPCIYTGRDMKTSHAGLGITRDQWDISVKHFVATLDKFKVPAKEKEELLAIVGTLEKDIVEKSM
jgi:hemoglobin